MQANNAADVNTFARIEYVCTFKDGLSVLIKSICFIGQSNLFEHLVIT